jgi:DNA adenine methylase
MADWIIANLPPHRCYVEPFFGSGAIFFRKAPAKFETINDIDDSVVNLFKMVRDRNEELAALIEMTPWSRTEFYASYAPTEDNLERARRFLVRTWQAIGAKTATRGGWRSDVSGKSNGSRTTTWKNLPRRILDVATRLKDAQIECRPAMDIITRFRYPHVLLYVDPPYVLGTRKGKAQYLHEMTNADHVEMLDALDDHPGPVLLSGYACPLYDDRLRHWGRLTHDSVAETGRREEVLWLNPVARQGRLFD